MIILWLNHVCYLLLNRLNLPLGLTWNGRKVVDVSFGSQKRLPLLYVRFYGVFFYLLFTV